MIKLTSSVTVPVRRFVVIIVLAVLILALAAPTFAAAGEDPLDELRAAWDHAARAGAYHFSVELHQANAPAQSVANIGQQAHTEQYHIEGARMTGEADLEMTMWSNGGTALDFSDGVSVRVQGDKAYARYGESAWEEINNFTGLFAPNNDPLAYLSAASQVEWVGEEQALGETYNHYRYTIDSARFSDYMSEQLSEQARQKYGLPSSLNFDLSEAYQDMQGSGEIWLDARGFPRRHVVDLRMPSGQNSQLVSHADITFSGFDVPETATFMGGSIIDSARRALASAAADFAQSGPPVMLAALFLIIVARWGRRRRVYAAVVAVVIVSIVFSPLLQSAQVAAFFKESRAEAKAAEERSQESEMEQTLRDMQTSKNLPSGSLQMIANDPGDDSDGDGITDVYEVFLETNPFSEHNPGELSDAARLAENGIFVSDLDPGDPADDDGDGLTNTEEILLGTASWADDRDNDGVPDGRDTDGDGVSDFDEVNGFEFNGKTWYTDPLEMDTNKDGINDGLEWNSAERGHPTWDLDGDLIPDLFDSDNDNDGVPDRNDLSPSKADDRAFSLESPLTLSLEDVEPGWITFIDLQLRPTQDEYLRYAFNVLDWPTDKKGQMQDWDNATYASGDPSLPANPNANGDMKLIPMLEVRVGSGSSGLPLTGTPPAFTTALQDMTGSGLRGSLRFFQGNRGVEVQLTDMMLPSGLVHYNIPTFLYSGTCDNLGSKITGEVTFGSFEPYTARFDGLQLANLVDGNHALVTFAVTDQGAEVTNPWAEWSCANLPRLPRENGKFIDTAYLSAYGISVGYASAAGEDKVMYAPLSVVAAEGNTTVAFQTRLVLRPEDGGATAPITASMVWVVQALMDSCATSDLSSCALLNSPQAIHTYRSDFRLTGAGVREDHGAETAVIFEDINYRLNNMYPAGHLLRDDGLFALAQALSDTFLAGRDCDSAGEDGVCVVDGELDMTLSEVERRFDSRGDPNPWPTPEERWGLPSRLFHVNRAEHQSVDEARASTMQVQQHLNEAVSDLSEEQKHQALPTLLFATTETYRAANVETQSGIRETGALVLSLAEAALITANDMNWKPYQWDASSDSWVNRAIEDQWESLGELYGELETDTLDPEEHAGELVFLRLFYTALYQGMSSIVKIDGKLLSSTKVQGDAAMYSTIVKYGIKGGGEVVRFIITQVLAMMMKGVHIPLSMSKILKGLGAFAKNTAVGAYKKICDLINWFRKDLWGFSRIAAGLAIGGLILVAILGAIYAATALLAKFAFNASWGTAAVWVLIAGAATLMTVAMPLIGIAKAIYALYKAGQSLVSSVFTVLGSASSIIGSTVVGAVIGLVVNFAVAWGVFIYQWASGAIQPGSIAFKAALAAVAAQMAVAVLTFIMSLFVIGTIMIIIVSVIDYLLMMLCNGFEVKVACFSINGMLTNAITEYLYGVSLNIDTSRNDLVMPTSVSVELGDPNLGYVTGNRLRVNLGVDSFIKQMMEQNPGQQKERMLAMADDFYRRDYLVSTAMSFAIDNMPEIPARNSQQWQFNFVKPTGPYIEEYWGHKYEYYLWEGYLHNKATSPWYDITETGLNRHFPAKLNLSFALPGTECIAGACSDYTFEDQKEGADLQLYYDILPATLDEFLNFTGWAGNSFPRQADPDGDGAHWSVDPDETLWDTDGDGLSDGYELELRANGSDVRLDAVDSDNDGLTDLEELIHETDPGRADTDGDGLTDGLEVNGWMFTYAPGKFTLARSNPTRTDSDGDSLSDLLEYNLYHQNPSDNAYHPRAVNEPGVEMMVNVTNGRYVKENSAIEVQVPIVYTGQYGDDTLLDGVITVTLPEELVANPEESIQTFPFTIGAADDWEITATAQTRGYCGIDCAGLSGVISAQVDGNIMRGEQVVGSVMRAESSAIFFDDTAPTAGTSFRAGDIFRAGSTIVVGGTASDDISGLAQVDVLVLDSEGLAVPTASGPAQGADTWAYSLTVPTDGSYSLCPYATDQLGHQPDINDPDWRTANCVPFGSDGIPADVFHVLTDAQIVPAKRDEWNHWTLELEAITGTDAAYAEARVDPYGMGWVQMRRVYGEDRYWLDYPLTGLDSSGDPLDVPNGLFTVQLRAYDNLGNVQTDETAPSIRLLVDGDGPTTTLTSPEPARVETTTQGKVNIPSPVTEITNANRTLTGNAEETGAVRTSIEGVEVRLQSAEDGIASGLWKLWYRNNSMARGVPDAVAETRDIDMDWGTDSPAAGIYADGFTADFQRQALFMTAGQYEFKIQHVGASTGSGTDNNSGTVLYIDGLRVGRIDGSQPEGTINVSVTAGQHDVRLVYFHQAGAAAVSMVAQATSVEWSPAIVSAHEPGSHQASWQFRLPEVEGIYQIEARGTDTLGNRNEDSRTWSVWEGEIDTAAPRLNLTAEYLGYGQYAFTRYTVSFTDFNLDEATIVSPCKVEPDDRIYYDTAWWNAHHPDEQHLQSISSTCSVAGHQPDSVELKACDKNGLCAQNTFVPAEPPNQRSLYWTENSEDSSVVRQLNVVDRSLRTHLAASNGEVWKDLASNPATGDLYFAEPTANGRITRLDPFGTVSTVWADEIGTPDDEPDEIVAAGDKLYWLNKDSGSLWISNLDGSAASSVSHPGLIAFDVDPEAGVIVGVVDAESSDVIVFLNPQGQKVGSMTADTVKRTWIDVTKIQVDPASETIFLEGSYNQQHWWGIIRVDYPDSFTGDTLDVVKGMQVAASIGITDMLVDSQAEKLYYIDGGKVMRANLDGSNPEQLAQTSPENHPYGLALLPNESIAVVDSVLSLRSNDPTGVVTVPLNAVDPTGLPLTYELISAPVKGHIDPLPAGPQPSPVTTRYVLDDRTAGQDQFTVLVSNGRGSQSAVTVSVNILPAQIVDAHIFYPTDGMVINSLDPIHVKIGLLAEGGILSAGMYANGEPVAHKEYDDPYGTTEDIWEFDWTSPGEGKIVLSPTLKDANQYSELDDNDYIVIWVDSSISTITFDDLVSPEPNGVLVFKGGAIDGLGVKKVEVRFDGGTWLPAGFDNAEGRWTARYRDVIADNRPVHVDVRVTDSADNQTVKSRDYDIDVVPPSAAALTFTAGGSPLTLPAVLRQPGADLNMSWTASSDGSGIKGYWAGWTDSASPDQADLTLLDASARAFEADLPDGSLVWAHLGIEDNRGNIRWQTSGPLVVDDIPTPDVFLSESLAGGISDAWIDSGATEMARQTSTFQGDEQFYATWNSTHLAFAWVGRQAAFENAFIYLDTGKPGGARAAFNPFGDDVTVNLPAGENPLEADFAIWGKVDGTAELLRWNGTAWESAGQAGSSILYGAKWMTWVSFADLGIINPENNSLGLVAFSTAETGMELMSAFPQYNPINSPLRSESLRGLAELTLQHQYRWDSLGGGVHPNDGKPTASQVSVYLWSRSAAPADAYHSNARYGIQSPADFWIDADRDGVPDDSARYHTPPFLAPGTELLYDLYLTNTGTETAGGLTAHLELSGALGLADGQTADIFVDEVNPGLQSVKITVKLRVLENAGPSGQVRVSLITPEMGAMDWAWAMHAVDPLPPVVTLNELPPGAFYPGGETTFSGTVHDNIGVSFIEASVDGQAPVKCHLPDPKATTWTCNWIILPITGEHTIRLRARDVTGSYSAWTAPAAVLVDTDPPRAALDDETKQRLSNEIFKDFVPLSGTVTDDYTVDRLLVCKDPELTSCAEAALDGLGGWSIDLPLTGEEDYGEHPIYLAAYDMRGSRSELNHGDYYRSDRRAPVISAAQPVTTISQLTPPSGIDLLTGTIEDGDPSAWVEVTLDGPGGTQTEKNNAVLGNWSYHHKFDQPGKYTLTAAAVDRAGNRAQVPETFALTVLPPVDLGVTLAASLDVLTDIPAEFTYTITAFNDSIYDAPGAAVHLQLPSGALVLSSTCEGTVSEDRFSWMIGTLAAGAEQTCDVFIQIPDPQTGPVSANAVISGDYDDMQMDNNTANRVIDADINHPPVISLNLPPAGVFEVDEGGIVTIDASSSQDPDPGDSLTFAWDLDNDGAYDDNSQSAVDFSAANLDGPADASVGLRLTDSQGLSVETVVPVKVINLAPHVLLPSKSIHTVQGKLENFAALEVSDYAGDVLTYSWTIQSTGSDPVEFAATREAAYAAYLEGLMNVCLTVTDDDGGLGSDCLTMNVANAPAVPDAGPDLETNEGQEVQFTFSFSDASGDETHSYCWEVSGDQTCGILQAGETVIPNARYTFPQDGVYTVTLETWDSNNPPTSDEMKVTVNNLPPVVEAGEDLTVQEGQEAHFDGEAADPGPEDELTLTWDFGDGLTESGSLEASHRYEQNGVYTAVLTADDSQDSASDTLTVTVENAPPTFARPVTFTVAANHLDVTLEGEASDPGVQDMITLRIDWDDGSAPEEVAVGQGGGAFSAAHTYAAQDPRTVTLTLVDDEAAQVQETHDLILNITQQVTVYPCLEVCRFQAPAQVELIAGFDDPDGAAGEEFTVLWEIFSMSDGIETLIYEKEGAYTYDDQDDPEGHPTQFTDILHEITEPGEYKARLTVTDINGSSASDELSFTVNEPKREISLGDNLVIDEGETITFQATIDGKTTYEPGFYTHFYWKVDCGTYSEPVSSTDLTFTYTFADNAVDPASPEQGTGCTVNLSAFRADQEMDEGSVSVAVNNVGPTLENLSTTSPFTAGTALNLTADLVESGLRDWVDVEVDWGDESVPFTERRDAPAAGPVTWQHTYTKAGSYTVTVTLTDKDSGSSKTDYTLTVMDQVMTVDAGPDQHAEEGELLAFAGTISSGGSVEGMIIHWDFGDGTESSGTLTPSHSYFEEGTYIVTLTVTDASGDRFTDTLVGIITNAAPRIGLAAPGDIRFQGRKVTINLPVEDPGNDPMTLEINWGDGSPLERVEIAAGARRAVISHTYPEDISDGRVQLQLRLEDQDGAVTEKIMDLALKPVHVYYFPVIASK